MNTPLHCFLHNHGNIATEGSPKSELLANDAKDLYIAHYHRQHCTLQAFEQFGALYMYNLDDKHPTRPEFEPSTYEFRATTRSNETSGPAFMRGM